MSRFSVLQVQQQIQEELMRQKVPEAVARNAAIEGANHYAQRNTATVEAAIAWAKTFVKPLSKIERRRGLHSARKRQ